MSGFDPARGGTKCLVPDVTIGSVRVVPAIENESQQCLHGSIRLQKRRWVWMGGWMGGRVGDWVEGGRALQGGEWEEERNGLGETRREREPGKEPT